MRQDEDQHDRMSHQMHQSQDHRQQNAKMQNKKSSRNRGTDMRAYLREEGVCLTTESGTGVGGCDNESIDPSLVLQQHELRGSKVRTPVNPPSRHIERQSRRSSQTASSRLLSSPASDAKQAPAAHRQADSSSGCLPSAAGGSHLESGSLLIAAPAPRPSGAFSSRESISSSYFSYPLRLAPLSSYVIKSDYVNGADCLMPFAGLFFLPSSSLSSLLYDSFHFLHVHLASAFAPLFGCLLFFLMPNACLPAAAGGVLIKHLLACCC